MKDAPDPKEPPSDGGHHPAQPSRSLTAVVLVAELIALTSGSPVIVAITGLLAWSIRCLLELGHRR